MSEAYGSAVRENLPNAVLVLDHFHVVKAFQEKLTDLRRDLYSKATEDAKDVLKGSRWLLLKNPENLVLRENAYLPFGFSLCEGFSAKSHFRGFQKPLSQ